MHSSYGRLFPAETKAGNTVCRIFSHEIVLPLNFQPITRQADDVKRQSLINYKNQITNVMAEKYSSYLMPYEPNGKIAYMLRGESPDEMLAKGGFRIRDESLVWVSNTGSGQTMGTICFSFLPEVTSLFTANIPSSKSYLYAFPLHGNYFLPGGDFRQIISPGAFPVPEWWLARELLGVGVDNRLELGPLVGQRGDMEVIVGERLNDFLAGSLFRPQEVNWSEDHSPMYCIEDTEWTKNLQKKVTDYMSNNRVSGAFIKK